MGKIKLLKYIPFIKEKNLFFAVRSSVELIEDGENGEETFRRMGEKYDVPPQEIKHYIDEAMREHLRKTETKKKRYKHFLMQWHPIRFQNEEFDPKLAEWTYVKALSYEAAIRTLQRINMQSNEDRGLRIALGAYIVCEDKEEADVRLARIYQKGKNK